jgi:tetratricopeptide (TPR) repeat protein
LHQQNPTDKEIAEEVLIDQKKFAPLIALYEQKLRKEPHNPVFLEKISYIYQLDGQNDQALYYREKLYAQTKNIVLLRSMGDIALKMKQTNRGLAYWEEYAIKSDSSEGWLDYAKNLYWAGKYEQAQTILAKITDKSTVGAEAKKLTNDIGYYLQEKERLAALPLLNDPKETEEGISVTPILSQKLNLLSNRGWCPTDHRLSDNAKLC